VVVPINELEIGQIDELIVIRIEVEVPDLLRIAVRLLVDVGVTS
jgi:hypothetical protein